MGNLRDQMEALAEGIETSARERKMAVGDSKAQTMRTLKAFDREHAAMARTLKSGLVADHVRRSINVSTMRADTGTMLEGFRRDHVRMRRSLRRGLAQSTEAVATFVASLRADFAKGRADFAKAHRHMTRAQRTGLAKDRRNRSREVAELMNDFQVSRGEMAEQLRYRLGSSLCECHSHIHGLLERFSGSRRALQEDIQAAHQIWSSLSATEAGGAALTERAAPSHKAAEIDRAKADEEQKARERAETARGREAAENHRAEAEADRQRKAEEKKLAKEAWAKMSDEEKILHVIQNHPGGISASQIGEVVDLHASVVGRTATELVERGEVGKNESTRLYFPLESK